LKRHDRPGIQQSASQSEERIIELIRQLHRCLCSVLAVVLVAIDAASSRFGNNDFWRVTGALVFAAGIALRWWARCPATFSPMMCRL